MFEMWNTIVEWTVTRLSPSAVYRAINDFLEGLANYGLENIGIEALPWWGIKGVYGWFASVLFG